MKKLLTILSALCAIALTSCQQTKEQRDAYYGSCMETVTYKGHDYIVLSLSDNGFGRIGVLHGQITRITSHSDRIYLSFSIRAYGDLFGEYDEMVGGVGTRILSRRPCFPHDYKKMPVVCISENSGEFSRRPPFFSIGINMLDALESLFGFLCQPCTHNLIKTSAAVSCPYDVTLRGTTPAAESNILK